jgi:hopanoid biosynthesis associated RND transporter like protein HpnN
VGVISRFEARTDAAIAACIGWAERRARAVVVGTLVLTTLLAGFAVTRFGVDSDPIRLISERLPFRQRHDRFAALFPNLTNALLIVVEGQSPAQARSAAERLAGRLAPQRERFRDVYVPGSGAFFERNGLLYRSADDLDELGDQIARMQPFLLAIEREPTLANLALLVRTGLERVPAERIDAAGWSAVLDRFSDAAVAVHTEFPLRISWEELLLRGSPLEVGARQVIIAEPVLDFGSLLPAGRAMRAVRDAAAGLAEPGLRVRLTGNPALNDDEMRSLAWDVGWSGLLSFAAVVVLVWLALRSGRLVVASLATLLVGLVWTGGFAVLAVGHLNLVSATFAVLYIGLGIDFAIHLGMHFAELQRAGVETPLALREAGRRVGASLVLCALTTTIGFYAFLPTDYRGVAELGLIAGTGMVVILVLSFTFLPALLSSWLAPPRQVEPRAELRLPVGWSRGFERHPGIVRGVALAGSLGAAALLPGLRFEPDVVDLRNPGTESVQAFQDLVATGGLASPWFADVLAPDLDAARELAERLRAAPGVGRVVTLADFVPADQEEKREILADLALLIDPAAFAIGPRDPSPAPSPSPAEQVAALRALHGVLAAPWLETDRSTLGASARRLRNELARFLARVELAGDPGPELARLEALLLADLPRQVGRLRAALEPASVGLDDLPADLVRRMRAPDGRTRVQVFADADLREPGELERFTDAVVGVAPEATGMAVDVVEFGRVVSRSLVQALGSALLTIGLLVFGLWRRLDDTLLALAPLLLASLFTGAWMVLVGVSFNFANVIVLPLLLGVGVDSAIHLVHRARQGGARVDSPLLATTTARAVFYSFATTVVSFGNLALSGHRGIASLGLLLVVGMTIALACNLVVLPALIEWRMGRSR